jgi:hypothetical protein
MLLTGGPSVCLSCGRTFTRGGAFTAWDSLSEYPLCMWCLAGWLEEITNWAIVDQMRGWLVSQQRPNPPRWQGWTPPSDESASESPSPEV